MCEKHPAFETPPDICTIWKYMSFAKLAWLIATESLHFLRLDQHDDEWEGLVTTKPENIEDRKYIRFTKYINCWHINHTESDAMWKLYGPGGETVAIKTTVGALRTSLQGIPVYMGKINYKERNIPKGNLYWPVVFKRKPFQHEKELRLCISSAFNENPPDLTQLKKELTSLGVDNPSDMELLKGIGLKEIKVPIDLNQLIREVIICPNSKPFLMEAVKHIVKSKVSHARIRKSKI